MVEPVGTLWTNAIRMTVLPLVVATLVTRSSPACSRRRSLPRFRSPVFVSVGLPVEGVGILLAVDLIPDVFKTTAHVTAHMSAAAVVHRWIDGPRASRGDER